MPDLRLPEGKEKYFALLMGGVGVIAVCVIVLLMHLSAPSAALRPAAASSSAASVALASQNTAASSPSSAPSPWQNMVEIEGDAQAKASDPSGEYITLYASASNPSPIDVTGWRLESARTGKSAIIGEGAEVPLVGQAENVGPIQLAPGQTAIVSTGRSPIGVSFLENECTGYLEQFQSFTPALPLSCPSPSEVFADSAAATDTLCRAAVENLQPCKAALSVPSGASNACSAVLGEALTYNGCVASSAGDGHFEGNEWRVYLGKTGELWQNDHDTILLLDSQNRVAAKASY